MMKQAVDKSARQPAGRRMNAEAGRFVENKKMLVLKENFQRHGFRQYLAVFIRRKANANKVARFGHISRLDAVFADGDPSFANKPGQYGAGKLRQLPAKPSVQPNAAFRLANGNFYRRLVLCGVSQFIHFGREAALDLPNGARQKYRPSPTANTSAPILWPGVRKPCPA